MGAAASRAGGAASLVVAGPPCQGHSALNNHTRHDDPRNDLYLAVARVARLVKPKALIVENVRGVGVGQAIGGGAMHRSTSGAWLRGRRPAPRPARARRPAAPNPSCARRDARTEFRWKLPHLPGRDLEWAIGDLLDVSADGVFDTPSRVSPDNARRIEWLFETSEYDLPNHLGRSAIRTTTPTSRCTGVCAGIARRKP